MDVSPKTLREVEFREKMRGYHPEDVDQFLERVAAGLEVLQDRLRQAIERAQRAEQAASEVGGNDDTLRRTLLLAQRTADMAVQEAREEAARIVAEAEQRVHGMMSEAEQRARRGHEDTVVEVRAELTRLEATRDGLQLEIQDLARWLDNHRAQLRAALEDAMARMDHVDLRMPDSPGSRPDEPLSAPPADTPAGPITPAAPADPMSPVPDGPNTMAWPREEPDVVTSSEPIDIWQREDPADASRAEPESEADPYFAELRRAISDQDPLAAPPAEGP